MVKHFNFKGTHFTTISRSSCGGVSGVMRVMSGTRVVERILEGRGHKLYLGGGGDWFARPLLSVVLLYNWGGKVSGAVVDGEC